MNILSEEELLSIIDRYGYNIINDNGSLVGIKRNSLRINPEKTPMFGSGDGSKYWQLKRIAAWIMEKEEG